MKENKMEEIKKLIDKLYLEGYKATIKSTETKE